MRRGGGGRRLAAAMAATAAATAAASPGPPAVALCANDPVSSLGAMLLEDERRSSLKVGALRVAGAGAAKPKDICVKRSHAKGAQKTSRFNNFNYRSRT